MNTPPSTSSRAGPASGATARIDLQIRNFVQALAHRVDDGKIHRDHTGSCLTRLWLQQGRSLHALPKRLKKELAGSPNKRLAAEIDFHFPADTKGPMASEAFRQELRALVARISDRANDPGAYQQLVRLGLQCCGEWPRYYRLLKAEHLPKSRLSEIARILESPHAKSFAEGRLGVRRALFLARLQPKPNGRMGGKKPSPATQSAEPAEPVAPLEQALNNLLDLAQAEAEAGGSCWPIRTTLFGLSFQPAAPVK